jgi:hypothetical protein
MRALMRHHRRNIAFLHATQKSTWQHKQIAHDPHRYRSGNLMRLCNEGDLDSKVTAESPPHTCRLLSQFDSMRRSRDGCRSP